MAVGTAAIYISPLEDKDVHVHSEVFKWLNKAENVLHINIFLSVANHKTSSPMHRLVSSSNSAILFLAKIEHLYHQMSCSVYESSACVVILP